MVKYYESLGMIQDDFQANGIGTDAPAFYDNPRFIEIERDHPDYLNNYARYVQQRKYSDNYIETARKDIPAIANVLNRELVIDGRLGACVDMSGVFSRILEAEGYWNFVVKGSLSITFPHNSGISRKHYWSIDSGDFVAGHAWVYAPPFFIADLTIRQQPYSRGEGAWLPDKVLSDIPKIGRPTVVDIVSPEVREYCLRCGVPESDHLEFVAPELPRFLRTFETYEVAVNGLDLRYVPVAIGAPDCTLGEMAGFSESAMRPIDMYNNLVVPALRP